MRLKLYLSLLLALITGSLFCQTITFTDCDELAPVTLTFDGSNYVGDGALSHYQLSHLGSWILSDGAGTVFYHTGSVGGSIPPSCSLSNNNGWMADPLWCDISNFTLNAGADVSTISASATSATTATLSGNVTFQGASTISERGFVYNTTGSPTTSSSKVTAVVGSGSFSANATSLNPNTTYYVKAYAVNSLGTSYGAEQTFTTPNAITVNGVSLQGTNPTNTSSVIFQVIFSSTVTGVTTSAFSLTTTGSILGAGINSVSGSGTIYTVNVTTGSGDGTIRLDISGSGITQAIVPFTSGQPYTIDKTPPGTTISAHPPSLTNSTNATFSFLSNESPQMFEQSLDGAAFSAATSPLTLTGLTATSHTIAVRAKDAAGNVDANPPSYTWTVDNQPPAAPVVVAVANGATTTSSTPTYSGTAENNSTVTVYVDGTSVGTTTASSNNWSFTQPSALSNGFHTVYATATDAATNVSAASNTNTFIVSPLVITSSSLTAATVAVAYSKTLTASGGTAPYSFARISGSLPAGLALSAGGAISGIPTAGGTFNFTVQVTDANSNTATQSLSLTVNAPTITVSPTTLTAANEGLSYSATITASGGISPYTYSALPGSLPSGLTLAANGLLSGTPTVSGTFNFSITGQDAATGTGPYTGNRLYSLTINPRPIITFTTLPGKTYGNGDFTIAATSDNTGTPITFSSSNPSVATINGNQVHIVGAGSTTITASQAADATHGAAIDVPQTLTVSPAALTITPNPATKIYGGVNPIFTASYSGFVNGDNSLSFTTAPTFTTIATSSSPAGNYPITVSGAVNANYTISYQPGNLFVTPAPLTITPNAATKTYGAAVPVITVSYSGFVNGENESNLTSLPMINTDATVSSPVGSYRSFAYGALNPNYVFLYSDGVVSVTPAVLTITADNQTKVYGAALPLLTASYSGFVNGDDASDLTTGAIISTAATSTSPVGTYGITASGAANANYSISYVPGNLSVTPAALTITADDQSKVYGAAVPSLTATYSGFVNGDNASSLTTSPTISTVATNASPVGTYTVTASGAVDPNYMISYVPGNLAVTPAALTITPDDKSKVYGTGNPPLTVSYNGFVNGDDASDLTTAPTITTTAITSSTVGNYTISATGAANNNYNISYADGNLSVTPATLNITADNKSKIYGTANPSLTVSYNGFVNGDDASGMTVAPAITTTATTSSAVGNYAVNASGAVNANYNISYTDGNLSVTPAALIITADNKAKVYGANNPPLTVSYNGFVNGDNASGLTTAPIINTTATTSSAVGSYTITATGATNNNYNISYADGNLSVTPAALTITADDKSKVYGTGNPSLTVSYNGFVNGDDASGMATAPTITTTATTSSGVGNYTITATGAANNNYNISYADGNLSVTPATLNITADNKSKVYGTANPSLTISYNGFVNGDDASGMTVAPVITTTATTSSAVGNYVVNASGAVNANYNISYTDGSLSVTPASLTITADNKSKVYGAGNPSLTVSYNGFVNGDDATSMTTSPAITTTATTSSAVGNYTITSTGAVNNNYNISYANGNLSVTPAVLTITADDKSKVYGTANPSLTVSYNGFVNGDDASGMTTTPVITTSATTSSSVGTYAITASGAANANYNISYTDGNLSVTPASLTITADDKTKVYGTGNPSFTVSYNGFVNGDEASGMTTMPVIATAATSSSAVGDYAITASGAANANYNISYVNGNLSVTPATLTITADDKSKMYGTSNPLLSISYSGFVNGDNASGMTTAPSINTPATASSSVGNYAITASGAVNANYNISYIDGTLSITPAALTITADDKARVYGEGNPLLTASYSGFLNGDNASSMTTAPAIVTTATTASAVGNYTIAASGAANANYSINYVNGHLSVTPATLTITADDKSKVYGTVNPSLTATYSGFVNGDDVSNMATAPTINTTATNTSAAGNYAITASGAANTNYNIRYIVGNLSITPASLTITADDKSKVYGAANPALTFTYSGFVNGDDAAGMTTVPLINTTATTSSAAGNYTISASGANNANYNINYVDGTLAVTPAALTITAENAVKTYGDADPLFTYTAAGWVNGDDKNIITGSLSRNAGENVGNYAIVQNNLGAGNNYTINYTGARLTVSPATLAISANAQTKIYGKQDPVLTYTASGWKNGDGYNTITGSLTRVAGENAGSYAIQKGSINAGSNYNITYSGADLSITKAPQVITWVQELTTGCNEATSVKLTAVSNSGLPVSYSISNNDIATISDNTLTPGLAGSTGITAMQAGDDNHFAAAEVTNTLINRSSNSIGQHWSDVIVFDNSSNNFVQWQWYKNNNPVASTTKAYYSESNSLNGVYYVIATDKNGNTVQSCPLTLTGNTTIAGGIKVFPNPADANSNVTVTCNYDEAALQNARLAIMDPTGKVWQEITSVRPTQTIKAPPIQGIYYISLVLKNGQKVSVNLLVK